LSFDADSGTMAIEALEVTPFNAEILYKIG